MGTARRNTPSGDGGGHGPIMAAAVAAYLDGPERHRAPLVGTLTVTHVLDHAMGLAHRWGEPELAACLLVIALARRQAGGLVACAVALRHALAGLGVDLPLDPRAQPDDTPLIRFAIDENTARDLAVQLESCDVRLSLDAIRRIEPGQAIEAMLWARHYLVWQRKRPYRIDAPEMPAFLKSMTHQENDT